MSKIFALLSSQDSTIAVLRATLFVIAFSSLLLFLMHFSAEEDENLARIPNLSRLESLAGYDLAARA